MSYTKQEEALLRRLRKARRLFAFLRDHRHELFDDGFQAELAGMYRDTGAGAEPVVPALMAMALLLQGSHGVSDHEAVELTVVDLRWQMVLARLGCGGPASSQSTLVDSTKRRIAEMHIDRGYIASPVVQAVIDDGGEVICKPWVLRNGKLFTKGGGRERVGADGCVMTHVQPNRCSRGRFGTPGRVL